MGKPPNSTNRSSKRKEAIYNVLQNTLMKKERVHKNNENALTRLKTETDKELRENYGRKQRKSKRR